jgi:hypothetical protein
MSVLSKIRLMVIHLCTAYFKINPQITPIYMVSDNALKYFIFLKMKILFDK